MRMAMLVFMEFEILVIKCKTETIWRQEIQGLRIE